MTNFDVRLVLVHLPRHLRARVGRAAAVVLTSVLLFAFFIAPGVFDVCITSLKEITNTTSGGEIAKVCNSLSTRVVWSELEATSFIHIADTRPCTRTSLGGVHLRMWPRAALYTYTLLRILTGLLNTLSGAYCFKAKAAIQANKPIASASGMAVPVQGQMIAPM